MRRLSHRIPQRAATLFLAGSLLLPTLVFVSDGTQAAPDSVALMGARLPTERAGMADPSAVWTGSRAYIFGGHDGSTPLDNIWSYDPAADVLLSVPARLPWARSGASAVWTGSQAFIFGGYEGITRAQIFRFDPTTNSVTTMGAELPTTRFSMSAVWDGTYVYLFGGQRCEPSCTMLDDILRYDPAADAITTMSATLPTGRSATSAIWDGSAAYVFGGCAATQCPLAEIVRYEPSTNTVTTLTTTLPSPRYVASAAWDGAHAYVVGGSTSQGGSREVVRYTPATGGVALLPALLPTSRSSASAVWADGSALVFGGYGCPRYCDGIVRFDPGTNAVVTMGARFPATAAVGRSGTSAAWTGGRAYVLGGWEDGWPMRQILQFDPAEDRARVMGARLPGGRAFAASVATASHIYLFGGRTDPAHDGYCGGVTREILRYDPATDSIRTMAATLPTGLLDASAAWDGQYAYLFGGHRTPGSCSTGVSDAILQYDPATDTLVTLNVTLPTHRWGTTAVWAGSAAYIFGGDDRNCCSVGALADIVRFDPATNNVTRLSTSLPVGRTSATAVWDGRDVYIFGGMRQNHGCPQSSILGDVVRFNPATSTAVTMSASMSPRCLASAVWDGANAYIFGGEKAVNSDLRSNEILRYHPGGEPQAPTADPGPARGEVTVRWETPSAQSYSGQITGYRIHRGEVAGGETFVAQVGNALSFIDTGLPDGVRRYYRVSAVTSYGESPRSSIVTARTLIPPGPPTGLDAETDALEGVVRLQWSAPTEEGDLPLSGYRIYRSTERNSGSLYAEVQNVLSFVDNDVPAEVYYYTVSAVAGSLEGDPSNEDAAAGTDPTGGVPSAPRDLVATQGAQPGQVTLTWRAPATDGGLDVTNYRIYHGLVSGGEMFLVERGDELTFTHNAVSAGPQYYQVSAVNALGEGPRSSEVTVTVPTTIRDLAWPATGTITCNADCHDGPNDTGDKAQDIDNVFGTPVMAAYDGIVVAAGARPADLWPCEQQGGKLTYSNGWGNFVVLEHSGGETTYFTAYAHLATWSVSPGDVVRQGDTIGTMGNTGCVLALPGGDGSHLHFVVATALRNGGPYFERSSVIWGGPDPAIRTPVSAGTLTGGSYPGLG